MTDATPRSAPAGWYRADLENQERYWDGTGWTDQVRPYVPAPSGDAPSAAVHQQTKKKHRSVLGIIGLSVATIGLIFACIPGALVVGWVLLPIGFILGIVALFQKDKRKWQAITAIGVSMVGTIVGAIVFVALTAGALSDAVDDTAADEIGNSDAAVDDMEEPDKPAAPVVEDLVLGETAFGVDTESGIGWYAVQVTNPNENHVFASAGIDVEAYDANGVLVDTDSTYGVILSGTSWYVGDFFDIGSSQIDHIEVRGPTAESATHSPAAETGMFTVSEVTTGSEYDYMTVNGTVSSNFSEDQNGVRIDLIARDGSGRIVGVDYTFTDRVPAGGTAAWNVGFWEVPLDSKVEAYPHL